MYFVVVVVVFSTSFQVRFANPSQVWGSHACESESKASQPTSATSTLALEETIVNKRCLTLCQLNPL